ncbi:MAG: hypothetical protein AAF449_10710 [Myxococcota bacterium]
MKLRSIVLPALVFTACSSGEDAPSEGPPPTWSNEIRAIVENNCTTCHYSGGATPFALQTHEEVAGASAAMLDAMTSGRMPPWPADPACRTYRDERRLDAEDIEIFRRWVTAGTPMGEQVASIEVTPPVFDADTTAKAATAYLPELSSAGDDYRCFVLDIDFDAPTWIVGSTVEPATEAVHHVIVYALTAAQAQTAVMLDAEDEREGYTCFGGPLPRDNGNLTSSFASSIASWVPGAEPRRLPDGTGISVAAGSKIVMQVHYSAVGGTSRPDQTAVLLKTTQTPPARIERTMSFPVLDLVIPAGDDNVTVSQTITNWSNSPATITSFTGHMHLLGTKISAEIMGLNDESRCGLSIPNWDFDWQLNYRLPESMPMTVAPNEGIKITCTYDNSAAHQPFVDGVQQQPRNVTWGEGSLDEMCLLYATVVEPYTGPAAAPTTAPCAAVSECYAGSDGGFSDLLACEQTSTACAFCPIQSFASCGLSPCLANLGDARQCLTDCLISTNAFGGSMDRCLRANCSTVYDAVLACADPVFESGACSEVLTGCGLAP